MGIKMVLASSTTQSSTAAQVMTNRATAYQNVINSLNTFIGSTDLQGSAYTSAKGYAEGVLIPLAQGASLLSTGLASAAAKFPSRYQSDVGSEDLDEESLQSEITRYSNSITRNNNLLKAAMKRKTPDENTIFQYQKLMMVATANKSEAEEKLRKLRAYNAASESFCSDLSSLEQAVSQGLAQVGADYQNFNGSFPDVSTRSMPWVTMIKTELSSRNQEADIQSLKQDALKELDSSGDVSVEYHNILNKVSKGNSLTDTEILTVTKYAKQHPAEKLPQELYELLKKYYPNDIRNIQGQAVTLWDGIGLIYLASKINKETVGKNNNYYIQHGTTSATKLLDKLFDTERYYSQSRIDRGKVTTRITESDGRRIASSSYELADKFGINYENQLGTGRTDWKNFGKTLGRGLGNAAVDNAKSTLTVGLSNIFEYEKGNGLSLSESFKSAGKVAKGVAALNVFTSAVDTYSGYMETRVKAVDMGMEVGSVDYYQAQAGGVTIDLGKNIAVGSAATLASVGGTALAGVGAAAFIGTAPVWLTVGAGAIAATAVSLGLNALDKKFGITDKLKNAWLNFVKG